MKTFIAIASIVVAAGCGATVVEKSQETLRAQAKGDCGGADAKVVYYGLRGASDTGESACFGPTADKLAVVDCAGQRKAYWGFGDRWEARPGTVTAVEADHVEISFASSGSAVEAVARCGH